MSELIGNYYPALPTFEDVANQLRYIAEAGAVALDGLRAAIGRKKEEITNDDRANAEEVRKKLGKDVIPPRGTETSQPEGGETSGRKTLNPHDVPDD